jgi:putative endonuclease
MYTVYILFSSSINKYYIGQTQNLENRIQEHNSGETKSIANGIPWKIVFTAEVQTRIEVVHFEKHASLIKKGLLQIGYQQRVMMELDLQFK